MKWLSLHIGGQRWGVYLVEPKHRKLLVNGAYALGVTYFDECKIYIAKGTSDQALEDTLIHELLHATFNVCGGSELIGSYRKEERLVRAFTPVLHRLIKDLGFRFPKAS